MHDDATSRSRWSWLALLAIAAGGMLIRLVALRNPGGPLDTPGGYDDGVYFSSALLLFRGVLPYRDFVFVHPPGLLYVYGLIAAWPLDPARLFGFVRYFATLIGGVNIVLAGRIGGLFAAVLYAIYPAAIGAERAPFLEPVLNLACLSLALVWLRRKPNVWLAGALCGAACAVKVLGGIWLLAALASAERVRSDVPRFLAAAAAAGIALVAPLALLDPHEFILQTLLFHARRPPDGMGETLMRLKEMLIGGHVVTSVLALIALLSLIRNRTRELRFFAVAYLLTIAALLAARTYWFEYNSHLAASQCVLAGFGAQALMQLANKRRVLATAAIAIAIAAVHAKPLRQTISNSRTRAPEILAAGVAIRARVPNADCLFAFDPAWTLAGGRIPPIPDTYATQLLGAIRDGTRYPDANSAFQSPASQREIRARLESCRFAISGWRGEWQMNAETRAWFDTHFACVTEGALCLRQRGQ
jgi:hypothetical protein